MHSKKNFMIEHTKKDLTIVKQITVYDIERFPLPHGIKENLKPYALTNYSTMVHLLDALKA